RYGITQPKTVEANKTTTTNIGNYPYNRASIVKVTGKTANTKNLTEYRGNSALYNGYWSNGYWYEYPGVFRWDGVYVFENESTADAKFELKIPNPSNKVVFEKVNTEGQVLKPTVDETGKVTKGAKFTLEKNDGTIENPAATWTALSNPKFVDKDGRISYNKLDKGLYRLIENQAPEGYATPKEAVAYLKVDESGKIYQKVTVPKAEGTGTDEIYQEVSETIAVKVVNNKPIEFIKVDADDNGKILPGAEFKVLYKEKLDDKYKEYKVDGKTLTGTSEKDGKFSLNISKDGYYALEETKAPDGYSKFPGYIKEFRILNGKVQTLEKSSKQGTVQTDNDIISSQTIEINEKDKTFKQRIILNPNQKEWHFDGGDTQLRLYEN
ncbi:MAG: SpaA isopeptide-forming pilin-related protein, partial [Finegoldia magna]|nr:SpaA isopeptide-forming pilin-related protein [Finegoldia magna]